MDSSIEELLTPTLGFMRYKGNKRKRNNWQIKTWENKTHREEKEKEQADEDNLVLLRQENNTESNCHV